MNNLQVNLTNICELEVNEQNKDFFSSKHKKFQFQFDCQKHQQRIF